MRLRQDLCAAMAVMAASLATFPTDAQAATVLTFSGVFDGGSGPGATLVGTPYEATFVLGTTAASVERYVVFPLEQRAQFLYTFPYRSAFTSVNGGLSYAATDSNLIELQDNFNYDGSLGIVSAGLYDIVSITGRLFTNAPHLNPAGCTAGGFDDPDCFPSGTYVDHTLTLIGTADMFSGLGAPLFDRIEFGKVIYGLYDITGYLDGVQTGQAIQDPPLTYVDGVFSGAGMTGSLTSVEVLDVPEPATWAMMVLGFGAIGGMMRRRHHKVAVTYS